MANKALDLFARGVMWVLPWLAVIWVWAHSERGMKEAYRMGYDTAARQAAVGGKPIPSGSCYFCGKRVDESQSRVTETDTDGGASRQAHWKCWIRAGEKWDR